jgi:hypothetical protein
MYPCAAPTLNVKDFKPQVILEITDLAVFSGSLALSSKNKTA